MLQKQNLLTAVQLKWSKNLPNIQRRMILESHIRIILKDFDAYKIHQYPVPTFHQYWRQ